MNRLEEQKVEYAINQNNNKQKQNLLDSHSKLAKKTLNETGGLTSYEQDMLFQHVKAGRESYIAGEETDKAKLIGDLNRKREQLDNIDKFKRDAIANNILDEDGMNKEYRLSEQASDITGILSGATPLVEQNGEYGYRIHDPELVKQIEGAREELAKSSQEQGSPLTKKEPQNEAKKQLEELANSDGKKWMSTYDIEELINEQNFDRSSNDILNAAATNAMETATKMVPGREVDYNYEAGMRLIASQVVEKGNKRSLIHDPHVGGKSFYQNLQSALLNHTYSDLGIDDETIKILDPTDDGRISEDDAKIIADAVVDNDEMVDDQLTRYYTNFVRQNHDLGVKSRPMTPEEDPNEFA
tara:strand:- start:460 stop:1527 length:1068 start_codon:yes stop_codon:yes gene_type:complete